MISNHFWWFENFEHYVFLFYIFLLFSQFFNYTSYVVSYFFLCYGLGSLHFVVCKWVFFYLDWCIILLVLCCYLICVCVDNDMCWRQCGSTWQIYLVMKEEQHIFMQIIKNNQGERYFSQVLSNCKGIGKGRWKEREDKWLKKTIDQGIATNRTIQKVVEKCAITQFVVV